MRVRELKPRDVIAVELGESLRVAAKHLADDDVGALVVESTNGVVGIFSERDLVRAVADGADLDEEPVEEYFTEAPLCVEQESGLGGAIATMNEYGVRHLIVVEGADVLGMISMRDVMAVLGTAWPEL